MESNPNTIGKRIAALRKQAGYTQEQLAEKLGVTPQAVSKWENDISCPDISMLPDIAAIFAVSTDELLGQKPMRESARTDDAAKSDPGRHGIDKGGVIFGIIVIVIGAAYLLNQYCNLPFNIWGVIWPAVVMGLGISWMVKRFTPIAAGVALVGLWFLLKNVGAELPLELSWSVVWPVALILLGLTIVFEQLYHKHGEHKGSAKADYSDANGFVNVDASFTEDKRKGPEQFNGADIDISFGSGVLDLSKSVIMPGACIKIDVSFGAYELWLPRCVKADVHTNASFGAANVKGEPDPTAVLLSVSGDISFGALEVKYI